MYVHVYIYIYYLCLAIVRELMFVIFHTVNTVYVMLCLHVIVGNYSLFGNSHKSHNISRQRRFILLY